MPFTELYSPDEIINSGGACYCDLRERLGLEPHEATGETTPVLSQHRSRALSIVLTTIASVVFAIYLGFVATSYVSLLSPA